MNEADAQLVEAGYVVKRSPNLIDRVGDGYGKWLVLRLDESSGGKTVRWICQCACGKVKSVLLTSLVSGSSRSCGCGRNHGKSKTATYISWASMITRCTNPHAENF